MPESKHQWGRPGICLLLATSALVIASILAACAANANIGGLTEAAAAAVVASSVSVLFLAIRHWREHFIYWVSGLVVAGYMAWLLWKLFIWQFGNFHD